MYKRQALGRGGDQAVIKTKDKFAFYGGKSKACLLYTSNMDSGEITFLLDSEYDIATRSGIHCAPLAHKTLGTLEQGAVRFSIGYFNTKEEIDKAIEALKEISKNN